MEQNNTRLLLCTDLDRTLIPNGTAPEDQQARQLFARLCRHPQVCLVYVTGRDRQLVLDALEHYELPRPHYAITDVGSTIYQPDGGNWRTLPSWNLHLQADWPSGAGKRIRSLVGKITGPVLQEESKQNTFKVSYYVPLTLDANEIMGRISHQLQLEEIPANLIWSIDEIEDVGLLDVLPERADKRRAIRFLQQQLAVDDQDVLFAGDSGNDLQVINSDIPSILVANAAADIKEAALTWAQQHHQIGSLYIAKGGLLTMNGNYSAGILEGVCYFQPAYKSYLMSGAV
ncbi:MAG: HAD-IIB family hydrolase [Pelovirga sp.]